MLGEREGQPYLEAGAFADLAVNGYLPHHLAQDAGDIEAQPAAGELALAVGAIEGVKSRGSLSAGMPAPVSVMVRCSTGGCSPPVRVAVMATRPAR